MSTNPLMQTLLAMSGQSGVITIHRIMVKYTGSYEVAAMLSQLLYWTPRSRNDGWIAKSDKEWMEELYISRRAVRTATETLERMGLVEVQLKKFNGAPTNHYKINLEALDKSWRSWLEVGLSQGETMDCLNCDNPLSQMKQSLTEITTENTTINTQPENPVKHLTSEEYKAMTVLSIQRGLEKHRGEEQDRIDQYPEDVRVIISAVCDLFHLKCPTIKSKHASHWISESRELRDACGEFEKQVLVEIAEDFESSIRTKGIVPFTISGPHSLVNTAIAKAGQMRTRKLITDKYDNLPKGASKVYIGGKVFVPGVGEVAG